MLSLAQSSAFLAAASLLTLAPGPDNLMILSLGMSQGRRQGMAFGIGCALGCLSHTLLATLGISALLAASASAFMLLKTVGGLYLLYLGWGALRSRGSTATPAAARDTLRMLFAKGLFVNAINPKVILFFMAFLPQFIVPDGGSIAMQTLQLGLLFTLQAVILFGLLGYFSGQAGQWLRHSPTRSQWLDRIAGIIFVALGLRLLLAR